MKALVLAAMVFFCVIGSVRADHRDHDWGKRDRDWQGAPGPIAGAGLPVLAVGYGVYWLIRRRRRPHA